MVAESMPVILPIIFFLTRNRIYQRNRNDGDEGVIGARPDVSNTLSEHQAAKSDKRRMNRK